ncbi:MAG: EAL domain-containing protein [Oscillospiraceae bacterium]|nr:EAL domain-containing protein [Oscillospiraceae bacterium]
MRLQYSIVYLCLILALSGCAVFAMRSHKAIGKDIARLLWNILPPVAGNLIILQSQNETLSAVGCYMFFIGMDCIMLTLMLFIFRYCGVAEKMKKAGYAVMTLLTADVIQYLVNPFTRHAFTLERLTLDDAPYYRFVPHIGQTLHRVLDYGILVMLLAVLIIKLARSPRIYSERYSVMLVVLIVSGLWQGYYIISRTPVDRSMIGFAAFGLMSFYFSLHYRPMRLLDRMLAGVVSDVPEAILFFDANDRCIWANKWAMELLHLREDTLDSTNTKLGELFGSLDLHESEWCAKRCALIDGEMRYFVIEMHAVSDDSKQVAGSYLDIRDNTEEQQRLRAEIYNATHDTLTDLYTREYLHQQIEEVLKESPDTRYLIGFLDVKNFKIVNDVFSNVFGDLALKQIADWLRQQMSERAVFGRLGGDTFGLMMPAEEFDRAYFESELSRFAVKIGKHEFHLLIHMGLYEILRNELTVQVMFDRAHLALTQIKDEYRTHTAFYDDALRRQVLWSQQISAELPDAIAEGQLQPYLQPIVDREGKVTGAEALARWIHPKEGFLAPGRFIPVFEKNGMIGEVDRHMWRCACEILSRWANEGCEHFISVNISPKDFYFFDVFAEITALVREYGVDPAKLRIEITETVMMNESDERMQILNAFREAGFIVEMDDFGSGYSSLNMLKDMPVDVLKLDMKFLGRSENNQRAETILRNIMHLTKDLGIDSLTEGVETEEQYRMLSDMGCILFQGYHFAKPLPVADFEEQYMQ